VDRDLRAFYREWIARRRELAVLRRGDFQVILTDDASRVFAFRRDFGETSIVAIFNAGGQIARVPRSKLGLNRRDGWRDGRSAAPREIAVSEQWFKVLERGTRRFASTTATERIKN